MDWEIVIGIETHVQLSTRAKIFSDASTAFGAAANTQASVIDMALPGTLPVLNKGAVERAIRFGLATGGTINRRSIFARKNYFYPDLPKGYQISQYEVPIVQGGSLAIHLKDGEKIVRLTRAHLEEDAGKSLHEDYHGLSGIDLNRAGTPLLEVVSEPDMRSADEAVAYAKTLHALVRWTDICDGNMQEGSFRCDANVSVRRPGAPLGTRREIKNLNSFRFLQQAIAYEAKWQIETLAEGGRIRQATVLFDAETGETRAMRSKEEAHDYRYFPDPDLLPLEVGEAWIEKVRGALPELPEAKQTRYQHEHGLTSYEAGLLTQSREFAEFYESLVAALGGGHKLAASWMLGEFSAALHRAGVDVSRSRVSNERAAGLLRRIEDKTISRRSASDVFDAMWDGTLEADAIIATRGLKQISDSGELERICDDVIAANPQQVADYKGGKGKAFNSLVGQVMKASGGKANPAQVNEILKKKLG